MRFFGQLILAFILAGVSSVRGLAAENIVITGNLIDNQDREVVHGRVAVADTTGGFVAVSVSDSNGEFTFSDIKKGFYDFRIDADGFYAIHINRYHIDPDTAQYVKIKLLPIGGGECDKCEKGTISGLISDDEDCQAVPGVKIIIGNSQKRSISSFDGTYKIKDIPTGKYDVVAMTIAYSPIIIKDVILNSSIGYSIDFLMIFGVIKADLSINSVCPPRPKINVIPGN